MKSIQRPAALATLALLALVVAVAFAAPAKAPVLQPDKVIILSTTDVKGKTGPCG